MAMRNPESSEFPVPMYAELAGRLGVEAVEFVGKRLRKDFAAGQAACECRSFEAVAALQREWLQEAFEDYAQEASKVLTLTAHALGGGARRQRSAASQRQV